MKEHPVILFDGICNLCNSSVQFVIKHDPRAMFHFAALQGETGQQLLKKYGLSSNQMNSFILIHDNKAYTKSSAALTVAKKLTGMV